MLGVTFPDLVGYLGSLVIAGLYFLSLRGAIDTAGLLYPAVNLFGCGLVMVSLYYTFNPPSFVIETFWAAVSVYGIVRRLR